MRITFTQEHFEYFLLILMRMVSFVTVAPFFGHANVPARYKVGLAACLSLIVYSLQEEQVIEYATVLDYAGLVLVESIAGILMGMSAQICMQIISFSGQLIGMEIGLAMANVYDPTTRQQVNVTGSLYNYFILMLFIVSDMQYFLLSALMDSYKLIPIGGVKFEATLLGTFINFLSEYFIIGFRIILPVFAVTLIMNCIMGILTKLAPQIHMFSVGIQLKLLTGLMVLFITIGLLPNIAGFIFDTMKQMVISTMKGMY